MCRTDGLMSRKDNELGNNGLNPNRKLPQNAMSKDITSLWGDLEGGGVDISSRTFIQVDQKRVLIPTYSSTPASCILTPDGATTKADLVKSLVQWSNFRPSLVPETLYPNDTMSCNSVV